MKTIKYILSALTLASVLACNEKPKKQDVLADLDPVDSLEMRKNRYLEKAQFQKSIDEEMQKNIQLANDELVNDAAEVITATKDALRAIADSSYTDAKSHVEKALGKAETVTALKPDLSFAPLDFNIRINDLVSDVPTVKRITKEAEEALEDGKVQQAREMLKVLSSEIAIEAYKLPVGTYPVALKRALILARENKYPEAAVLLNSALNTIVVEKKSVPLPLVRAERMLMEVDSLVQKDGFNTEDVRTLLDNASYEIKFAETLGYGKKDREFKELDDAIKEIEKQMEDKSNTDEKGLIKKLRGKLGKFKERIS
jgi:hypothetical protein